MTNKIEMVQKLELMLFKFKLGIIANIIGAVAKYRLIR